MKTLNVIAKALSLTAVLALTACGGGAPDAETPETPEAPDKEGIAEEAMDDVEESIDDIEDDVEDAEDDLD